MVGPKVTNQDINKNIKDPKKYDFQIESSAPSTENVPPCARPPTFNFASFSYGQLILHRWSSTLLSISADKGVLSNLDLASKELGRT
ncbi:hypothetical protein H5410_057049 [Solanum commersonii]|uniref:Uncharacterized protein n=1 Tax=Solanum commersonii TaxID=4109 RepID=A0A9J5WLW5_SOLCO|nr:hypothetical protein H5410_057049 [Solanum commersonii]